MLARNKKVNYNIEVAPPSITTQEPVAYFAFSEAKKLRNSLYSDKFAILF